MENRIPHKKFIGRKKQLAVIDSCVKSKGIQVVSIEGSGGIGKSYFLHQIKEKYEDTLKVSEVMDFWALSTHDVENVMLIIARSLGEKYFKSFIRSLQEFRKGVFLGVSPVQIDGLRRKTQDRFWLDYEEFSNKYRLMLLVDSFEKVHDLEIGKWLISEIGKFSNTLICIAGRENKIWRTRLLKRAGIRLTQLAINQFIKSEVHDFFNSSSIGVNIDEILREKLYYLTMGRPILLDLTLEWYKNELMFNWSPREMLDSTFRDYSINDLQHLDVINSARVKNTFSRELVRNICRLSANDGAIVYMAYVNRRFDKHILSYLLSTTLDSAEKILRQLLRLPYVKYIPYLDSYFLHDEMRDLVLRYVWPMLDPTCLEERSLICQKVSDYYDSRIIEAGNKISHYLADEVEDANTWDLIVNLKDTIESYEAEKLYYQILGFPDQGIKKYKIEWEKDIWSRRYLSAAMKKEQKDSAIKEWQKTPLVLFPFELSELEQQLENVKVNAYQPGTDKVAARKSLIELSENLAIRSRPNLYADVLITQSYVDIYFNSDLKLADITRRAMLLGEAEKLLSTSDDPNDLPQKIKLHFLEGETLKRRGYWHKALDAYRKCLDNVLLSESSSSVEKNQVLNELGYLHALAGNTELAQEYCDMAVSTSPKSYLDNNYGRSLAILGLVFRERDDFSMAENLCQRSLLIHQRSGDEIGTAFTNYILGGTIREKAILEKDNSLFARAEELLLISANLFDEAAEYLFAGSNLELAILYNNWFSEKGALRGKRYSKASKHFQIAIEEFSKQGSDIEVANSAIEWVITLIDAGQIGRGTELFQTYKNVFDNLDTGDLREPLISSIASKYEYIQGRMLLLESDVEYAFQKFGLSLGYAEYGARHYSGRQRIVKFIKDYVVNHQKDLRSEMILGLRSSQDDQRFASHIINEFLVILSGM